MYNSVDIAKDFGIHHRGLLRIIRSNIDRLSELSDKMFTESSYTSIQNKKIIMFLVSEDGLKLLMSSRALSKNYKACVKYLELFGDSISVVVKSNSRFEDDYFSILSDFVGNKNIIRQYPIAGYRVDFFIDPCSVFIEFDEEHHLSKSNKERDDERWNKINAEHKSLTGQNAKLIRVRKGGEIKSLGVLSGFLSLNSKEFMIAEHGVENSDIHLCD